ncbi:MAG: 3-phosphoshikimate 1-carboxyvinyltransferase [Oscillospiraceae bacterium]|nr:3-phosphoshikimate 1-carboxyvinyltransferase [Oscillospiraceae bacterium]
MDREIAPGPRYGVVRAPASKSQLHRLLICAAVGQGETEICSDGLSRDVDATRDCLCALGARIRQPEPGRLRVTPIASPDRGERTLPCGESGSTLRFLLPQAGVLGCEARFLCEGRLPRRPIGPLADALREHGMEIEEDGAALVARGVLRPGTYTIGGEVSSQFVSGLLMALTLLEGDSSLRVTGRIVSSHYIRMTEEVLRLAGIRFESSEEGYRIPGGQRPALPAQIRAEGDWSNAAVFLCMGALSPRGICVSGLDMSSAQGDRAILEILRRFGAKVQTEGDEISVCRERLRGIEIDAEQIPDLIPPLSVLAAAAEGETRIFNAGRLRTKESDRLSSSAALLRAVGAEVQEGPAELRIFGRGVLSGGTADSFGDHRIAMSAALAACASRGPVLIHGADRVEKSYPRFWEDLDALKVGVR